MLSILAGGTSPIEHVVVIDFENHSFDNVLGEYCVRASAGSIPRAPCDGAVNGRLPDGSTISLIKAPDLVPESPHSLPSQKISINGGAMNGFANISNCGPDATPPYRCYATYGPTQIPNISALATAFGVSDRTFEFRATPTWASHMALAAATLDGFQGNNPNASTFTSQTSPGYGCDGYKDAKWWDGQAYVLVPSCVPDQSGNGPYRPSPVSYVPTIFDRVEAAGLTWKIYAAVWGFSICPTFYECLGSNQLNNLVPANDVITDATNGTLPNFSIVSPPGVDTTHNGRTMADGDNWLGTVLTAIREGPEWLSTAVFVTWDDCGCFYDHVAPPRPQWGIRVPLLIISPYAKAGFTDSSSATFVSLLAYAEHTFGLMPLVSNTADSTAYDYSNAFDYSQAPLALPSMTHTPVPAWEREYVRTHSIADKET